MKKTILLCAIIGWTCSVLAQDNIQRPESYNYQSGVDAYREEDYAKSMDFFDKELQQNPKNGYAVLWQAYIYEKYEKYGETINMVNKAIKLLPSKDKEWVAMGYGLRARTQAVLGDTVKALKDYEQAYRVNPLSSYIYGKCNIYHLQGKYSQVDSELRRLMPADENNAVTWVYMGRNDDAKGLTDKALEKYAYAVKLNPEYSSAFSFRADTYMAMHKYKEACQDVVSALSIDNDVKAYFQMLNLADSAMTILKPLLKAQQLKEPNKSLWSYYLGVVSSRVSDYTSAEQAFRDAVRIAEYEGIRQTKISQNLAETLNELGRYDEALETTEDCLAVDSTDDRTWIERADILYNMGRLMPAIENASKAIALSPDNGGLYYSRARLYMYNGMLSNALDDINTAVLLDSEDPSFLVQRCEIYQFMKRTQEAEEDCRAVIAMESDKVSDEQDLLSLAFAYARLNDKAAVLSIIDKAFGVECDKDDEYNKVCLYCLIGDKDSAMEHLEKSLSLGYCEFFHISKDRDLDNIRDLDRFKILLKEYQGKFSDGISTETMNDIEYIEETTEVPFTKDAGICKVKCTVNDLPLHFYFDTGAADVTISSVEAQFMLKNEYLKPVDIKGKERYGTASGDIAEGTIVMLKKVDFGGLELANVKATVVHNQKAPLLLGQTVLSRLGRIEIDYERNVLRVISKKRK